MVEVTIRPLRESDAAIAAGWRNDPEVWRLTANAPDRTITVEDEREWIGRVTARPDERRFAIEADGAYVGNIYLTEIHGTSAVYSVFLGDRTVHGHGIASRASRLLIEHARSSLGLRTLTLSVDAGHDRAIALYRRLGFSVVDTSDGWLTMGLDLRITPTDPSPSMESC